MTKTVEYIVNREEYRKPPRSKLWKEAPNDKKKEYQLLQGLEKDGLVRVGAALKKGSPILVLFDIAKNSFKEFRNK